MFWLLAVFLLIGTVNASVEIDTSFQWWMSDTLVRKIHPMQRPNGIEYYQRYLILFSINKNKCSIQSADLRGNKLFLSLKAEGALTEKTCYLSEVDKKERTGWQDIQIKQISILKNGNYTFGQDTLFNAQTNEKYAELIDQLTQLGSTENANLMRKIFKGVFFGGMAVFIIWAWTG